MSRACLCSCWLAALLALSPAAASDLLLAHPGVDLAISDSTQPDELAVRVVVGDGRISVDGSPVLSLGAGQRVAEADRKGALIRPLFDVLQRKADDLKAMSQQFGLDFDGLILIALARDVPYDTVMEVMYTAGQAQFGDLRFQVSGPTPTGGGEAAVYVIPCQMPRIHFDDKGVQDWEAYVAIVRNEAGQTVVQQVTPRPMLSRATGEDLPDPVDHVLPHLGPSPDLGGIETLMARAKSTCSVCEQVIIQPQATDSWQTVVQLLDATRESGGDALFPRPVLARWED